ncbi:MAG TPA: urea ABC transporter permease subunit UrtB [Thiothrix sp.]|nr:urea ABC transporter permease subunit UrtB [Thiothrix sp.]
MIPQYSSTICQNSRLYFFITLLIKITSGFLLLILSISTPVLANDATNQEEKTTQVSFEQAKQLLTEKSFKQKAEAIDVLVALGKMGDERILNYLQVMLKGKLYYHKEETYLAQIANKKIIRLADNSELSTASKKEFKKITINNKLRKQLRRSIALLNLSHPDADKRLQAVNAMLASITPDMAKQLHELAANEEDKAVKQAMQLGVNIAALENGTREEQLAAITAVTGRLHPAVRQHLNTLTSHESPEVAQAAKQAINKIQTKIKWYGHAETLFFGLSLGSVLVLAAIGLAITFGVMGVINMAHGELIMLGAYTTYMIQQLMPQWLDYSLFIAIPAAFIVSGLVGILIERLVIRHLYGRPLETLLATFGVSLILQQFVRTVISPQNVPVANPSWMSGTLEINSVLSLTYNRLYIILFCLMVFISLYYLLRKSALGLQVQAVSQNRQMARAMGVRSARVDALTFGLGSGIAGVAGVALSQLTNVGPNLGQSYIIDSFMVVVFGGVGNLWGTLVAGLSLGVVNKVIEPWTGAVLAKIFVLVFIILFIQKRPRGLFPQKGRAAGD